MSTPDRLASGKNSAMQAAIIVLITLTGVMLLALYTRTMPHPPLEVPPFALGPFLGASLAIGAAAFHLGQRDTLVGTSLAIIFALTALVSFGPQKYFDPSFSRIWPAVVTAQAASAVVLVLGVLMLVNRRRRA